MARAARARITPEVLLKGFAAHQVVLRATDGTIISSGGRRRLSGNWTLAVLGRASRAVDFTNKMSEVKQGADGWTAASLDQVFSFTAGLVIAPNGPGTAPVFRTTRLAVVADPLHDTAQVSDGRISISWVAGVTPTSTSKIYLPQWRGGYQITAFNLGDLDFPLGKKVLFQEEGRLCVRTGAPEQVNTPSTVTLDHPNGLSVAIGDTARMRTFLEPAADGPALSEVTSTAWGDLVLTLDRNAGVSLRGGNLYNQRHLARVMAGLEWVRAEGFETDPFELSVWQTRALLEPRLSPVLVRGPQDRFSAHLPLSDPGVTPTDVPVLIYRDRSWHEPTTLASRYWGLRIRHLPGPSALGAWFAADAVTISLDRRSGSPVARLRAGEPPEPNTWPPTAGTPPDYVLQPMALDATGADRRLEIPVESMRVRWGPAAGVAGLRLNMDHGAGQLRLSDPTLLCPPGGTWARDRAISQLADGPTKWLELRLPAGQDLSLEVSEAGVFPAAGKAWLDRFSAAPQAFASVNHPGLMVEVNPKLSLAAAVETSFSVEVDHNKRTEHLAYAVLTLGVSYAVLAAFGGVKYVTQLIDDLKSPDVRLKFESLVINPTLPASERQRLAARNAELIVANKAPDDLMLVISSKLTTRDWAEFTEGLFDGPPTGRGGGWSLASGLAVQLYDGPLGADENPKPVRYAPQIVRDRFGSGVGVCGVVIDFSLFQSLDPQTHLAWGTSFQELADRDPALWPAFGVPSETSRLDPSRPRWRGFFFRNMPLVFDIPPQALEKLGETGRNLIEAISDRLLLDYGWRDETGLTWKASWGGQPISVVPKDLRGIIDVQLTGFETTGRRTEPITASGHVRIELPKIKDKQGRPLTIEKAEFGVDFEAGLKYLEVEVGSSSAFDTTSIPGFSRIVVRRFATDFKLARLDVEITPERELTHALPVLDGRKPIRATITMPLTGDEGFARIAFVLPSDREVRLFGKWGFTLQGMEVEITDAGSVTRIHGRLNLGLAGALTVGAWIELRHQPSGGWSFAVLLDRIDASLDLGGFRLDGMLAWIENDKQWPGRWADEANGRRPISSSLIAKAGREREFLGYLAVRGAGNLLSVSSTSNEPGPAAGDYLAVRIGESGQTPFWIGVLALSEFGLSRVGFRDAVLLVARNADTRGLLAKGIADLSRASLSDLRPPTGDLYDWLLDWEASLGLGTALAMSGRVSLISDVAEGPQGKTGLSGLVVTEAGLARLDTVIRLGPPPTGKEVAIAASLDMRNQYFRASVLLPKFEFPEANGEFVVHPGELVFGFGWGRRSAFELGVGYPPNVGNDPLNVDWTRSVKVVMRELWPINTVWGGFRISASDGSQGEVRLGFAIRAGWSCNYNVTNTSLVDARASVEVALGSITDLVFKTGDGQALPAPLLRSGASASLDPVFDEIEALIAELSLPDFFVSARWIFNADGTARGVILGMEILSIGIHVRVAAQVCGPTANKKRIIARVHGYAGFEISIKIGCDRIRIRGQVHVEIVPGSCVAFDPGRLLRADRPLLAAC